MLLILKGCGGNQLVFVCGLRNPTVILKTELKVGKVDSAWEVMFSFN